MFFNVEYAGHARDYVKTIQLADWSGIILASGDGLVFEVNNIPRIFYRRNAPIDLSSHVGY